MSSSPLPSRYVEHTPSPALRAFVECFWTRGAPTKDETPHQILPDGAIDIVLGYGPGSGSPNAKLLVGTMTRPLAVRPAEHAMFVGVRFWPGRAYPFLGIPASEVTDLSVDLGDVWAHRVDSLEAVDPNAPDLLRSFERVLLPKLAAAKSVNVAVDAAVRAILRAGGNLSIAALAPALGVTRQYLARAFALHVGVPPKTFARVARVRGVLARARVASQLDWAALALEAGYYDQAHLASEVKELTGRTPSEWRSAS